MKTSYLILFLASASSVKAIEAEANQVLFDIFLLHESTKQKELFGPITNVFHVYHETKRV